MRLSHQQRPSAAATSRLIVVRRRQPVDVLPQLETAEDRKRKKQKAKIAKASRKRNRH